jgi:hypothetical protein
MTFTTLAPGLAAVAFLAAMLAVLAGRVKGDWRLTAALAAAFLAFSLWTVAAEGPVGFWTVHSASLWGNQVWFDLLLAIATASALLLPRLRACGMAPAPWLALVAATGCIGLLAALARVHYLEARA